MPRLSIHFLQTFGRLHILREVSKKNRRHRRVECICDCGNIAEINLDNLVPKNFPGRARHTQSCGCLFLERVKASNTTHGLSKSKEEIVYRNMINRCHDPTAPNWDDYGGRGIAVCPKWKSDLSSFVSHVGRIPSPGLTIERIDNNRGYEPGNVKWASRKDQARNRRNSLWVTYHGKRRLLAELCEERLFKYGTVWSRYRRGWPENMWFSPKQR